MKCAIMTHKTTKAIQQVYVKKRYLLKAYKVNLRKAALSAFFHERVFLAALSSFELKHKILDSERSELTSQLADEMNNRDS